MFKEIAGRFSLGFAVGNFIGYVVNLIISLFIGQGQFLPVMPQLQAHFSTEIAAVIAQTLLIGFIGVVFAETGLIFKIDRWSFLKQCIVHFLISACFYTPFVYLCYMPNNLMGILIMLANFLFTYIITYIISYRQIWRDIKLLNEKINEVRENESHRD